MSDNKNHPFRRGAGRIFGQSSVVNVPTLAEEIPGTEQEVKGYEDGVHDAVNDAQAGRLKHLGIYNQEAVEEFVKAAGYTRMEELKEALKSFTGTVRFPTEREAFFTKLQEEYGNLF